MHRPVLPTGALARPILLLVAAVTAGTLAGAAGAADATARPSTVVRVVPDRVGHGRARHDVLRVAEIGPSGVRGVATVRGTAVVGRVTLAPGSRRIAFVRDDLAVVIVPLHGGRPRVLHVPDLPRPDRSRSDGWGPSFATEPAWTADGRTIAVRRIVSRAPGAWVGLLTESRSVLCRPARGSCSSGGPRAASDLVPLPDGRLVRTDGAVGRYDAQPRTTYSGLGARRQRAIVRATGRPRTGRISVVAGPGGGRALDVGRDTLRHGLVGPAGFPVASAAGVLIRRVRTSLRAGAPEPWGSSERPTIDGSSTDLRPWLVTPAGRLRTLPVRLAVDPIGALDDGRWLLPTSDVGPVASPGTLREPGLATLDEHGRIRPLIVGGRAVTPVRLALDAGLSDALAASTTLSSAEQVGGDLFVGLSIDGYDGLVFLDPDELLLRIPLDGATPPTVVDHTEGADHAVR